MLRTMFCTLAAIFTCGCFVTSIDPLFRNETVVEPGLAGTWIWRDPVFGDEASVLTVTDVEGARYKVTAKDTTGDAEFSGLLGRVGSELYLDLFPLGVRTTPALATLHNFSTHEILKVELTENSLVLRPIDGRRLLKLIKSGEAVISCKQMDDGRVLLLGSTEELQNFISAHTDRIFPDPSRKYRRKI